eukprot:10762810-Karenia_brevis.AAC.1
MLLTILPHGHPDMGVIRGAGHALIVKERMKQSSLVLNTSKSSDHDFMDWVLQRFQIVFYHLR